MLRQLATSYPNPLPLTLTPHQVAMLRQLATSCMERAQEETLGGSAGSKPTSFWAAHSVGRPAPWQAT